MLLKKIVVAVSLCSSLLLNSCSPQESTSEVKVEPATTYAAVQTAIAIVQAIYERKNALNQADFDRIITAVEMAKQEIISHVDATAVREWTSQVESLKMDFVRYNGIRQDGSQLNGFLLKTSTAITQLKSIFAEVQVYQTHRAALAYNAVAAMYMVALADYMMLTDPGRAMTEVNRFTAETIAMNEKLLSVPTFPAHSIVDGVMKFDHCNVIADAFRVDMRDYVMYSGMGPWTMGQYKDTYEYRYSKGPSYIGSCFVGVWGDRQGKGAFKIADLPSGGGARGIPRFRPSLDFSNNWGDTVPVMYNENVQAMKSSPAYGAVASSNQAFKEYLAYFEKGGNNGTVSCKTYCEGEQWGRRGTCVGAYLSASGNQLLCSAIPGHITDGTQLTCHCAPPESIPL